MNQLNNKGEKHGPWEEYYNNGKLSHRGTYLNGAKVGEWVFYWVNGNLQWLGSYKMNQLIGFWVGYHSSNVMKDNEFFL